MLILLLLLLIAAALAVFVYVVRKQPDRRAYITTYYFPDDLPERLLARCPQVPADQVPEVIDTLRQYFLAVQEAGETPMALPSKVLEAAWQAFAEDEVVYQSFCTNGFGALIAPPTAQGPQTGGAALATSWQWWCRKSRINPAAPQEIPLPFALDARFAVADGWIYSMELGADANQLPALLALIPAAS